MARCRGCGLEIGRVWISSNSNIDDLKAIEVKFAINLDDLQAV